MNSKAKSHFADKDGFVKVKYKKRQKLRMGCPLSCSVYGATDFDLEPFKRRLCSEVSQFVLSHGMIELKQLFETAFRCRGWKFQVPKCSMTFDDIAEAMRHYRDETSSVDIVCYGLASFTYFIRSRKQLALLIILALGFCSKVFIFDPVFNDKDKQILNLLSIVDIRINEQAKRKIQKNTLFFMPHCPHELYSNVLSANWSAESLSKIAVIGNEFKSIADDSELEDRKKYKHLCKATLFVDQYPIPNTCFDLLDFSSIHLFDYDRLSQLPEDTWANEGLEEAAASQ